MAGTISTPKHSTTSMPNAYDEKMMQTPENMRVAKADRPIVLAYLVVAFVALFLGGTVGLLQSLQRSGHMTLPSWLGYYQLVTAHGVLLALVFTTYFIFGFLYSGVAVTLSGELYSGSRMFGWAGWTLMTIGGVMTTIPILAGKASVLYTFYAPMAASKWFYLGLTIVVVGSWVSALGLVYQYRFWRSYNDTVLTPLFPYMAFATMLLWFVCTLGVAGEMLTQLVPWSFGVIPTVNVLLTRTLFWYFGHPLVYFWLMPAYMAWYTVMPKLIGGKVFSDSVARLSFMMLAILSVPIGFHHQLTEPGIPQGWKLVHVGGTLLVVIPSLMTAFALFATMERAGRARGYTGWFGWLKGLPWGNAPFFAMFSSMFIFILGGAGGVILASHQLDVAVHNTIFVTGHFHLTVATASALTFMGTAYWLVPHVTGRVMTPTVNKWAWFQVLLWVIGMTVMSTAQHVAGLLGAPRRTAYVQYKDPVAKDWAWLTSSAAVGGTILYISILVLIGVLLHLAFRAPKGETEYPLAEIDLSEEATPMWLGRFGVPMAILGALILISYSVPLYQIITDSPPGSPMIHSADGKAPAAPAPSTGSSGDSMAGMDGSDGATTGPEPTTTAPAGAAAGTMVATKLGEFFIKPDVTSVKAGTVTFKLNNVGKTVHEFVVIKTDVPAGKLPQTDGKASEKGKVGEAPDLLPKGATTYLTFTGLKPGKYVLLCNVPGHYVLGQYSAFTVT